MTIRDVADYCGVSVSTVSRVLNERPDVSKEVRKRVLDAVRDLHYIPNNSARDLVRTSSESIGVVVRGAGNPFFTSLIRSIEETAETAGYTIILSQIPSYGDELATGASLSRSRRLKGLIFLGGCFDYDKDKIASLNVPFVCCTFTNHFGSLDTISYSSVSIDDRAEAARAVRYLISKGHRRIAILLASSSDHSISQLRYMGYCDALKEAGIEPDPDLVEEIGTYDMDAAYNGAARLAGRTRDFTAIFVIADSLAIAAMKALNDKGISVPGKCSLIAIDGLDISQYTIPTLTTLAQPRELIGREAVRTLIEVMDGTGEAKQLHFKAELNEGGTVADIS